MELTNEIKATVLGQYLGQQMQTTTRQSQGEGLPSKKLKGQLKEIDIGMVDSFIGVLLENETDVSNHTNYNTDQCKLILKPLSDITDEDALEVANICRWNHLMESSRIVQAKELLGRFWNGQTNLSGWDWIKIYQYLQSKGYDLPHLLLKSKTLQECGLAIYEQD